jgi:hypothetical protein
MNTYTKERDALVKKTLRLIAAENNWEVKNEFFENGQKRTIYKIPSN